MTNLKKNTQGYGYKYTELADVNTYIESIGESYYQGTEIDLANGKCYIYTVRSSMPDNKIRGCEIINVPVIGKDGKPKTNLAQEIGSGLTYARRYSLQMAYGLATTDDDGKLLDNNTEEILSIIKQQEEFGSKEWVQAKDDFQKVVIETDTDIERIKSFYKVDDTSKMTISNFEEAIKKMKSKEKEKKDEN